MAGIIKTLEKMAKDNALAITALGIAAVTLAGYGVSIGCAAGNNVLGCPKIIVEQALPNVIPLWLQSGVILAIFGAGLVLTFYGVKELFKG